MTCAWLDGDRSTLKFSRRRLAKARVTHSVVVSLYGICFLPTTEFRKKKKKEKKNDAKVARRPFELTCRFIIFSETSRIQFPFNRRRIKGKKY